MYCNKIHACRSHLFKWSTACCRHNHGGKKQVTRKLPLKVHLCIDLYIAKFNVKKKYGISYGSIGLMSFSSFFKVCYQCFKE